MDKFDIRLKKLFFLLFWGSILLFFSGCKPDKSGIHQVVFRDNKKIFTEWEDVFEYRGLVPFKFDNADMEIFSIGNIVINAGGEYIIQDGRARKIMVFAPSGKFSHDIGRQGEGPGEFLIPSRICLDKRQDLYVFDQLKRTIIKYLFPGYGYGKQVRLDDSIADMLVDEENHFIIYRLASLKNRLLFRYDNSGKLLKSFFKPEQEKLCFFLKRFLVGDIADIPGVGFLFIYPEGYNIYLLSYDLQIKKILTAVASSRYYPFMGKFPSHLSPFDFTKEHIKWLEKSLIPASLFYMGKGIFITVLLEGYKGDKTYVNVHDLDGINYARGLLLPFPGVIRFGRDGDLLVVEESTFDDRGEVMPLKLHRYKIKDLKQE